MTIHRPLPGQLTKHKAGKVHPHRCRKLTDEERAIVYQDVDSNAGVGWSSFAGSPELLDGQEGEQSLAEMDRFFDEDGVITSSGRRYRRR